MGCSVEGHAVPCAVEEAVAPLVIACWGPSRNQQAGVESGQPVHNQRGGNDREAKGDS